MAVGWEGRARLQGAGHAPHPWPHIHRARAACPVPTPPCKRQAFRHPGAPLQPSGGSQLTASASATLVLTLDSWPPGGEGAPACSSACAEGGGGRRGAGLVDTLLLLPACTHLLTHGASRSSQQASQAAARRPQTSKPPPAATRQPPPTCTASSRLYRVRGGRGGIRASGDPTCLATNSQYLQVGWVGWGGWVGLGWGRVGGWSGVWVGGWVVKRGPVVARTPACTFSRAWCGPHTLTPSLRLPLTLPSLAPLTAAARCPRPL